MPATEIELMLSVAKKKQDGHTMSRARLKKLCRDIGRTLTGRTRERCLKMVGEKADAGKAPSWEQCLHYNPKEALTKFLERSVPPLGRPGGDGMEGKETLDRSLGKHEDGLELDSWSRKGGSKGCSTS